MIITSASGYGANTRQPFVDLLIGDRKPIQLSPDEARSIARDLIEAAEAAEQDAFLVEWGAESFGGDRNAATVLLLEFRKWRDARRKSGEL
jgi:hypothetical protein